MFNQTKLNPINSNNNKNQSQFPQQQFPQPPYHTLFGTKNEYSPLMNMNMSQATQQQQQQISFYNNGSNNNNMPHSKSYSLPANFQESNTNLAANVYIHSSINNIQQQQPPPPPRTVFANGDIPLPNGWELEKTSSGQVYYINHITKTTSWDDPRKLYNLPMNQVDISNDTRAIINSIALPSGWEEARTVNNEMYYINHITKTTTWEDPRISIYMQQQQQQHLNERKCVFNGASGLKVNNLNSIESNRMLNSSSTSSICSTSSSCSFTSSSSSSLTAVNNTNNIIGNNLNAAFDTGYVANKAKFHSFQSISIDYKENLKKNLDDLLAHKNMIIKQIDDLTKQEMSIKAKLSHQDIEQVLQVLNATPSKNVNQDLNNKENILAPTSQTTTSSFTPIYYENVNNISNTSSNMDSNDMDTTLVTENSVV